jgi:hypothetical protein
MSKCRNILYASVVLIGLSVGLYCIIHFGGHDDPDVRDTVLAVAGGVFGGFGFEHVAKAYPELMPKTE